MGDKVVQVCDGFDITFISLVYRQAGVVTQHLDSILYQKNEFLQSYRVQLVISDDGSGDDTLSLIQSWVELNRHYFESVSVLCSDVNQGTCRSFVRAARLAKGRYIKVLAGDDIFLSNDLSIP